MRKLLLLLVCAFLTSTAGADPLETWTTYVTANPYKARQVMPMAYVARGIGTDDYYVLEVDPATGNMPVSASVTINAEGTPGAAPPAVALYTGGTDGTNLRGLKTDSSGELQVDVLSSALPTGAATSANQSTANSALAAIEIAVEGTLTVDGSGVTQPVSAASLPLPTGASTEAKQDTQVTHLAAIEAAVEGTVAVSAASLPLPTGAATEASLASIAAEDFATQTTLSALNGKVANGAGTAAGAVRVTIASDSPQPTGRSYADSIRIDYSSTNVTTGAWVELIASTAAAINALTIFDSCGQVLELGTGAAAAEARKLLIPPGGADGVIPLAIAAGTRVSIKAVSGNCTSGQIVMTGLN